MQAQTAPPPPPAAPLPGFVPPYEITKTVRAAGFDPLAPPRREGTTYVLRATDFRGILMRVVVDARSGAIRAVNRIVSSSAGPYGPMGMMPPYGPPPYAYAPPPPYAYGPPPYDASPPGMPPGMAPPPGTPDLPGRDVAHAPELTPPGAPRVTGHPELPDSPPLPRPRPSELAAHDKPAGTPAVRPETSVKIPALPAASTATTPPPSTATAAVPSAPATPKRPPTAAIQD